MPARAARRGGGASHSAGRVLRPVLVDVILILLTVLDCAGHPEGATEPAHTEQQSPNAPRGPHHTRSPFTRPCALRVRQPSTAAPQPTLAARAVRHIRGAGCTVPARQAPARPRRHLAPAAASQPVPRAAHMPLPCTARLRTDAAPRRHAGCPRNLLHRSPRPHPSLRPHLACWGGLGRRLSSRSPPQVVSNTPFPLPRETPKSKVHLNLFFFSL